MLGGSQSKAEGKVEDLAPPTFNIPNIQNISLKSIRAGMSRTEETAVENRYVRFLERHLPAAVVLTAENTVLHFFGNYSDYLALAPGRASLNFFHMLSQDLALVSATAISRCRNEHTAITYTDIAVDCPSGRRVISLTVEPIPNEPDEDDGLVAVVFQEHAAPAVEGKVENLTWTPLRPGASPTWSGSSRSPRTICGPRSSAWRR